MPDLVRFTDERSGASFEAPIASDSIHATALRQAGLVSYDPAFLNTASVKSSITYIDGDLGILRYRGYPIEQLAERSSYLEVAYLLVHGELPTESELAAWTHEITFHTFLHENVKRLMEGFRYDAHPMGMFVSVAAALSTYYPESRNVDDAAVRMEQIVRLIAKTPTIGAWSYRHSRGLPYVYPDNELGFAANFLSMMFRIAEPRYDADPALERALEVLFILHADHEQNCSTSTVRMVGSANANMFTSIAAGIGALSGPLHGAANQAVIEMLEDIAANGGNIRAFVDRVKNKEPGVKLMGFGHRVYKNYDPRAAIVKQATHDVLANLGVSDPLLDLAIELESIALADEYFVERKLYPNVDFYSGVIYKAMGFPTRMFTVLFALGRLPGWIAHWREMMTDSDTRIGRPRQVYNGATERDYLALDARK
ncbi:MAG TPA: citrate synthase [Mycobacteriales bacterium]|nr:citrate synthase [Mycobacteriales bacterium]